MWRELWGRTGPTGGSWQHELFPVPCYDRLGEESRRSLYKITAGRGKKATCHLWGVPP